MRSVMIPSPAGQPPLFDADDLLLYAASPFAFWMERHCLADGGEGFLPDPGSRPPESSLLSQAALADSLPGKVVLIDCRNPEPQRRQATLQALRSDSDWIVDGQLTGGGLSTTCNLLKRDPAAGNQDAPCYLPCVSQPMSLRDARVHLCLAAELLSRSLGGLPARLLVMRGSELVESLNSDDWMPLFRPFLQRFLDDQAAFDVTRPPDPCLSLDFGRWRGEALRLMVALPQVRPPDVRLPDVPAVDRPAEGVVAAATPEPERPASGLLHPKGHPLDTPGFNVLAARARRPARDSAAPTPLSPVLDTRQSLDDE